MHPEDDLPRLARWLFYLNLSSLDPPLGLNVEEVWSKRGRNVVLLWALYIYGRMDREKHCKQSLFKMDGYSLYGDLEIYRLAKVISKCYIYSNLIKEFRGFKVPPSVGHTK